MENLLGFQVILGAFGFVKDFLGFQHQVCEFLIFPSYIGRPRIRCIC